MSDYDAIHAFIAKLGLWQRRVQKGNAASFPNFDAALEERNINLEGQLKLEIESPTVETRIRVLFSRFE